MGKAWIKERRRDRYYRAAKRMEYRSRAAFKLLQIQDRFHIIHPGDTVVDLGAAPGGWSQVAADLVGPRGRVIAVAVVRMRAVSQVDVLQGDITDPPFVAVLLEALGRPADAVVCDASPKLSGVKSLDQARAVGLAGGALEVAGKALGPGGSFVAKAFRGSDYGQFLSDVRGRFPHVKEYIPEASPKGSAEVYVVGLGRR